MDPQTRIFKGLADPTRRALFERLCREGELTVGSLVAGSGVSQPAVSKHLAALRKAGLVEARQTGRHTHFRTDPAGLASLAGWVAEMKAFWDGRLDGLEDLLRRMDQ